jgi:hypothetical protein
MDERLGRISELMKKIKGKVETIGVHNEMIKRFNHKLEALLMAFDTYTAEERVAEEKGRKRSRREKENRPEEEPTPAARKVTQQEFISRAESLVPGNKWFKANLSKIVECLYEVKEGVLLETIIKNSGVSKYRCVDILNMMIKTDPPLVLKRFEKGFIYTLNIP